MTSVMYFDTYGVNEIAEKKALGWLSNQDRERVILAQQNSNLKEFLGRIFDAGKVNNILREKRIILNSGIINLHTKRNPIPIHSQANVLLLYPTKEILEQIGNYSNLASVMVIPWTMDECRSWLRQQGARQME